jgi:hypothetical protein
MATPNTCCYGFDGVHSDDCDAVDSLDRWSSLDRWRLHQEERERVAVAELGASRVAALVDAVVALVGGDREEVADVVRTGLAEDRDLTPALLADMVRQARWVGTDA